MNPGCYIVRVNDGQRWKALTGPFPSEQNAVDAILSSGETEGVFVVHVTPLVAFEKTVLQKRLS